MTEVFHMRDVYDAFRSHPLHDAMVGEKAAIQYIQQISGLSEEEVRKILKLLVSSGFLYQPRPRLYATL